MIMKIMEDIMTENEEYEFFNKWGDFSYMRLQAGEMTNVECLKILSMILHLEKTISDADHHEKLSILAVLKAVITELQQKMEN